MENNTIKLTDVIRPAYDPYTGGKFQTCHRDLHIKRDRNGDEITETTFWNRCPGTGTYENRRVEKYSVSELAATVRDVSEGGLTMVDDVPEGFTAVLN